MNDSASEEILKDLVLRSSDPDFFNCLDQLILENSSNYDYLLFCVKYFPCLESENLIYYFLCIFRNWVNSDADLELELLFNIKSYFFSEMKTTSRLIEAIQMSVQIQLFLKLYPDRMPNFWADFFSIESPPQLKLAFIEEFANIFLNGLLNKSHRSALLNQMKSDDSELELVQYLLHLFIDDKNDQALILLAKNLTFIDPFENSNEENELMSTICSLINEHILPMINEDLLQMPTSIVDDQTELHDEDINQLKSQFKQIIPARHESFIHIETIITLLFHIIQSNTSQFTIIDQILSEFCERIQSIYENSINLLNQLFDIQNSPLYSPIVTEIYNGLSIELNNDIYSILTAISNFISCCSFKFPDAEITQNFYLPISLSLLKIPNDRVSMPVINFLKEYSIDTNCVSEDELSEKVKEIFFALGNRLTLYFVNNSIESEVKNCLLLSLLNAIKSILTKVNKQTNILDFYVDSILSSHDELIASLVESSELSTVKSMDQADLELPVISSMLRVLDAARDKFINYSKIEDVLEFGKNLLDIRPPISNQQFFTITSYMGYVKRVQRAVNDEDPLFQLMFESIYNFLVFDGNLNNFVDESDEIEMISEEMRKRFVSIANDLIKFERFYSKVEIECDQIVSLVKTGFNENILIASKMISKIPDDKMRFELFKQCLDELMSLFSESNDEVESIINMLFFIQFESDNSDEFEDEEEDEHSSLILDFCEQLFETALKNEDVLLNYLNTIQKVLDVKGISLFIQCTNKLFDDVSSECNSGCCFSIEIVSTICYIANLYIQQDDNDDWKFEVFCQIFSMVNIFQEFEVQDWTSPQSEEVKEIAIMFQNFLLLASHSCNFLDAKKNLEVLNYIDENVPILFQLYATEPLCESVNYLYLLTSFLIENEDESFTEVVEVLVEKFIDMTFSILKIERFSIEPKFKQITQAMFKFHQSLIRISHDETEDKLCYCFAQFPQSDQLSQLQAEYINFVCSEQKVSDIRDDVDKIYQFLHAEHDAS